MSDHRVPAPFDEPSDAAHDAVRDALPALLHGRLPAGARTSVERHLATCAACEAELQLLAAVRSSVVDSTPPVAIDRIAAAVRARTIAQRATATSQAVAATLAQPTRGESTTAPRFRLVPPPRRPAWARRASALRAFAATALLAVGSGALYLHATPSGPVLREGAAHPTTVAAVPDSAHRAPLAADPSGSLLGASFADLDDSELAAVVAAVAAPSAATPAAEPASVTPTVLTPDGE